MVGIISFGGGEIKEKEFAQPFGTLWDIFESESYARKTIASRPWPTERSVNNMTMNKN